MTQWVFSCGVSDQTHCCCSSECSSRTECSSNTGVVVTCVVVVA